MQDPTGAVNMGTHFHTLCHTVCRSSTWQLKPRLVSHIIGACLEGDASRILATS